MCDCIIFVTEEIFKRTCKKVSSAWVDSEGVCVDSKRDAECGKLNCIFSLGDGKMKMIKLKNKKGVLYEKN